MNDNGPLASPMPAPRLTAIPGTKSVIDILDDLRAQALAGELIAIAVVGVSPALNTTLARGWAEERTEPLDELNMGLDMLKARIVSKKLGNSSLTQEE
jgi:hypothetical protein